MGQGRPSHTAFRISLSLPLLAQDPVLGDLLPAGAAEATVRLLHGAELLDTDSLEEFGRGPRARTGLVVERHLIRGQLLYLGLRKRLVDDEVREALGSGARQVLVVGTGFDTLGLRLARAHPSVLFVEIDQRSTLEAKRAGARTLGGIPPNLHWLDVDLASESLASVLEDRTTWGSDERSVVVAEGLLMYLPPAAVSRFLETVRRRTGPGSRLVFSYLRPDPRGHPYMGKIGPLIRAALRMVGEPLRWAIADEDLPAFLLNHGFLLDASPGRVDLEERYLVPAGLGGRPLGGIERLAVAERIQESERDPGEEGL